MAKLQRGLGKGLEAIFPGATAELDNYRKPVQYINQNVENGKNAPEGSISMIDINLVEPNPYQPRVSWDQQALEELSASIVSLGLIQPITVRKISDDKYQIISGERRFRASKMAGLTEIPAYVRSTDDRGMLEMAIVENVQRYDLDPIETAMSYQRLIDECHLTQEKMAERIGKSRVVVTNFLRLLRLPAKVQYDLKTGNISVGHAKVLLGLEDSLVQEKLSDEIISGGLSVRALEQRVKEIMEKGTVTLEAKDKAENAEEDIPQEYYDVAEIIGRYFSNNVSVKRTPKGAGSLTIRFKNDEQIALFAKALKESGL